MEIKMKPPIDDVVAFFSGLFGGSMYAFIAGITWTSLFENALQLFYLGFIAAFTGAMGVVGKHLIGKYLNKKKKP